MIAERLLQYGALATGCRNGLMTYRKQRVA